MFICSTINNASTYLNKQVMHPHRQFDRNWEICKPFYLFLDFLHFFAGLPDAIHTLDMAFLSKKRLPYLPHMQEVGLK